MRVCDMCKSYEALHLYTDLFVVVLQNVMHSRCSSHFLLVCFCLAASC